MLLSQLFNSCLIFEYTLFDYIYEVHEERERDTVRQTDIQTDRQRERASIMMAL